MSTPVAWAFSAPITSSDSGRVIARKPSRVKAGVVSSGAVNASGTSAGDRLPVASAAISPTTSAASTGGTARRKRCVSRNAATAAPATQGALPTASTAPVPKRISAPAIMAMTMGIGIHRITRPIRPLTPSNSTRTPLMMNAPTASLKLTVDSAPTRIAAPGMEYAPVMGWR